MSRELGSCTVVIVPTTGMCHVLNSTGQVVWAILAEPRCLKDVISGVMERCVGGEPNEVRAAVTSFVETLRDRGLLAEAQEAPSAPRGCGQLGGCG